MFTNNAQPLPGDHFDYLMKVIKEMDDFIKNGPDEKFMIRVHFLPYQRELMRDVDWTYYAKCGRVRKKIPLVVQSPEDTARARAAFPIEDCLGWESAASYIRKLL